MEDKIRGALKAMLTLRAAKMDPASMKLYTARLSRENSTDVIAALQTLAEMPRAEYETAVPDISTILKLVEVERLARMNRSASKQTERLVRWQCTENPAHTMSGFPSAGASLERRCQGIPKTRRTDWKPEDGRPICGAQMKVIHDDNEVSDSGPMERWVAPWAERSGAR